MDDSIDPSPSMDPVEAPPHSDGLKFWIEPAELPHWRSTPWRLPAIKSEQPEPTGPGRALALAAAGGDIAEVDALLDAGTDIESTEAGVWDTPLMAAVSSRHATVVTRLMARGANATNRGHRTYTPIQLAQMMGALDLVAIMTL